MYSLLRRFLFLFPPERVHYFSMNSLRLLCSLGFRKWLSSIFRPRGMEQRQWPMCGLTFRNPVGLGAGFDKNAKWLRELEVLGFGFVEIGTVTPLPQPGNEKPRLFRLPADRALINRMGFNNEGVKKVAMRLGKWRDRSTVNNKQSAAVSQGPIRPGPQFIIGGNIGKNKNTPNEEAWRDYEICFRELHPLVDYFVVNVSSPNTPGLRELQEKESLRKILTHLQTINTSLPVSRPLLLKIAPDLGRGQLDDVISLALEIKLDGLVAANTTIGREGLKTSKLKVEKIGAGGLSGLPLKKISTDIVSYIREKTKGQIPIIASGGVFTGADAREKLEAGASLMQIWTGFIYEGPFVVKRICKKLT